MHLRRKLFLTGGVACLALLLVSLSAKPQVEVHGDFSKQDVAQLVRLARTERKREPFDWSGPPPQLSIRQITHAWRRFKYDSAQPIIIKQMPNGHAEVTIGTGMSISGYAFVKTNQEWKLVTPNFE